MLRLFFALQPHIEQNTELTDSVAPLVAQLGAQCVSPAGLHATLCFIGAVAEEKLESLKSVAAGIRGRAATLRFDALEHWDKPKVICATAVEDAASAPARELAERLGAATADAGFAPDIKPFRAHLTLARKVDGNLAAVCEWPRVLVPPLLVHCERFMLMRSDKNASGSIYSVVESWPLDA
jgi:2'-5' RNA ligase